MTSTSQQPSLSPQAANPSSATQFSTSAHSATPSASGTISPLAAVPASANGRSYASAANATKKPLAPAAVSSSPAVTAGPPGSVQHAKSDSVSPVNGKNAVQPAVPAITNNSNLANGSFGHSDHSRKSSVTITAAGTSGYIANGGPVTGPPGRTNSIQFGSMNTGDSSSIANNTSRSGQSNLSLPVNNSNNPRVTSPANSPSPIPQPAASGGRPPSGLQSQGNNLSFGSLGGESSDSPRQMRPVSMPPQGPYAGAPQPTHLRRESSQSAHSDVSNGGMGPGSGRGGFNPQGGRGRGYGQPYSQQMGYPPTPNFRGAPNQARGMPGMGPQFQGQGGPMGAYPNSPHRNARSPALANAHPVTPQMQQVPMANPQMQAHYGGYPPHMTPQSGQYGMSQPFEPGYGHYAPQYMYPSVPYMGPAPSSPRPPHYQPLPGQQQYMHGQFPGHAQTQPMSRSSSALSDRPNSSLGQSQPASMTPASSHSHQPSQGTSSPAPNSAFKIPRKSGAIVIKDPTSGAVKTFDKPPASPAPDSRSPAIISSTPTPPPRTPSQADSRSIKVDVKPAKTDEEKKNDMKDAIAKKIEADMAEEKRKKEEQERNTAKEKEEADRAEKAKKEEEEKALREKEEAEKAEKAEKARIEAEEAKKLEEEKKRKEEEEQQRKQKEAEEKARRDAEASAKADQELKNAEREAEEAEEARMKQRSEAEDEQIKAENAALFAALKSRRPPPASAIPAETTPKPAAESGASTPASEDSSMAPPPKPASTGKREKPAALKLEPLKTGAVEPPQPSAALQSLKSARFIDRLSDVTYPTAISSPNPSLNAAASSRRFKYDRDFLLQFQQVFTEKPSLDWDNKLKETVGDGSDSARPQSARTPSMGGKPSSARPGLPSTFTMGTFGQPGGRTLPPGTTSAERFAASNTPMGQQRATMSNPLARFAGQPGGFPMGGPTSMSRNNSSSGLQSQGMPQSPRTGKGSQRGGSKRGSNVEKKKEEEAAKSMPLTAGMDLKPLQVSGTGWKPRSVGTAVSAAGAAGPGPDGNTMMAPDMVQRKVKAALNKMTPEKFDRIADQILEIAAQSKNETDGRTLRQVIQLTFEKATDEAHWASMYAKFCKRMLETMDPEVKDESIKDKYGNVVSGGALFRKYLLNRCQEEFERGWKVNLPPKPEGVSEEAQMLSDEYYVAAAAKRRGLGLVQFIGELYKLGMLTERIMHECVKKLVDYEEIPGEAEVESLTKLLRTIGRNLDSTERGPQLMKVYFERIKAMSNTPGLPSRLRFMLMDIQDLRDNHWVSKEGDKGPKTIQEIREEAAAALAEKEAEKHRQSQRGGGGRMPAGRGDARSFSGGGQFGMMPPPDYQKNTVGMDDLRRLGNRASSTRQASQGPATLGPTSMFASRSGSGRKGLGPQLSKPGEESGASSRTATPPAQKEKEKESPSANAFSALAGLEEPTEPTSPTSDAQSPPVAKAKPIVEDRPSSPSKEGSTAS